MKRLLLLFMCVVIFSGCSILAIDSAISKYRAAAPKISLGDTKEKVLEVLLPTQKGLSGSSAKSPEAFKQDDDTIEIYYFRSCRQPDGLTTDDEFIPYVFTNGVLTGIGWTVLGGAQSHGKVVQPAPVTNINQTQKTTIY